MDVHLLVLNYNGRDLLARCLTSALAAAEAYRLRGLGDARVSAIDNSSTDGSVELLRDRFPGVACYIEPNRGLCSFNAVLPRLTEPVAVLLNNDVYLHEDALAPLVAPLFEPTARGESCFLTAARTLRADNGAYDGQKTAIGWRFGLVQATSHYAGCEALADRPALTASAGAAIAVERRMFLELGGFDPIYLPGRLEDLDLAFRAWQRGAVCRYVPEAMADHVGGATFVRAFGDQGNRRLALRNTLLWQFKNLRHPRHWIRFLAGGACRAAADVVGAPLGRPMEFLEAARAALVQWRAMRDSAARDPCRDLRREREYFRRFHHAKIDTAHAPRSPMPHVSDTREPAHV